MNDPRCLGSLEIRATRAEDLSWIKLLESEPSIAPFIVPWSHQQHVDAIGSLEYRHVVAQNRVGVPLGYSILKLETHTSIHVELIRIVVERQGQGFGRQLLQRVLLHSFTQLGADRVWLDVYEFNRRARRLYRDLGFIETGRALGESGKPLIIMELLSK